ncbi:DUF1642 domain-containing protein [Companilactobacillus paralimentarius]|uniref:DUF1642 domain-containing protein n=1 Tax=Companilactobacillus paralimentarius TaxID=83526 RepID=UPI00384CBA67
MNDVRILKGYSENEQKELEEAKDSNFSSAIALIQGISDVDGDCYALSEKYYHEDTNEDNQLARDIADFYTGKAKFAEPKKYYVQLIKNGGGYLNKDTAINHFMTHSCQPCEGFQTEFTEQEIKDIDPRYMAFAVPVEVDDE